MGFKEGSHWSGLCLSWGGRCRQKIHMRRRGRSSVHLMYTVSLNPLSWLSLPDVSVRLPTEASPLLSAAEQFALDEMFDCFICSITPVLIFNGDTLEAKAR
ncbi:uncharacterized protein LOC113099653 isoform X2 [Carassius auratus]|uniref:Uncharacterized protein LOC113099653 isoform X2 n=1 Tax=Carassius auratus TaxID=7957 RepID=A0A6P6PGV5_CARAU|nr:uncharacterized protein LOC113099653 isoform X2 [Carassius auratus]